MMILDWLHGSWAIVPSVHGHLENNQNLNLKMHSCESPLLDYKHFFNSSLWIWGQCLTAYSNSNDHVSLSHPMKARLLAISGTNSIPISQSACSYCLVWRVERVCKGDKKYMDAAPPVNLTALFASYEVPYAAISNKTHPFPLIWCTCRWNSCI